MRRRSYLSLVALAVVCSITYFLYHSVTLRAPDYVDNGRSSSHSNYPLGYGFPEAELPPLSPITVDRHPIRTLIEAATTEFEAVVKRQSKTLAEAVAEYKRRNGIPPPPNFDKWFNFAQKKGVVLIDEYDSVLDSLRPFWALPPAVVRGRAREALGRKDNFLIDVLIRDGQVTSAMDGWQQESTAGMIKEFIQWLPDMDLAFNTQDEPRVVVPHEDLSALVQAAGTKMARAGSSGASVTNSWSSRPADLDYAKKVPEVTTSRFNRFPHQMIWTTCRMSCPPSSPARSLAESAADNTAAYTYSDIALVSNHTAYSDICNTPSFSKSFGFFDRPNSFDITHDLFPIFSQSKISSFQDILYPSPWYWVQKVRYKQSQDMSWASKASKMYWRGSTTGGFARDGGWRRQHRQNIVRNLYHKAKARVFSHPDGADGRPAAGRWSLTEAPRTDFASYFDVGFSHFGQCDRSDCRDQESFFGMKSMASQEDAWKYKYLLDIDGNAFSGRFYAFLQSMSAAFKFSIFREWHDGDQWIRPWVHYVPLSLPTHEYVEVVRYFDEEDEGKALVKQMADTSRKWAVKALRNEDLEVWFFRLLLEYGRVVDDNRETIGFSLASA